MKDLKNKAKRNSKMKSGLASTQAHLGNVKYPLAINLDNCSVYNPVVFKDAPTIIIFEIMLSKTDSTFRDSGAPFIAQLQDLVHLTGLDESTCKNILIRFVLLGIFKGFSNNEADFHEGDFEAGYYGLDYQRILDLLPYLMGQWSSCYHSLSMEERYLQRFEYFRYMRDNLSAN